MGCFVAPAIAPGRRSAAGQLLEPCQQLASNPQVAILFGVAIVRLLAQQPESFTRSAVQPIHAEGDHLSFANRGIRV